jgi:acyl-CoA thioester hydrolase
MFDLDPNKEYPKQTHSQSIIRFQDCDPLKHLNNAKYFDYFFNAREDQVPKLYGLRPLDVFMDYQAGWVVYQHQIAYIRSAMVGEWVTIVSRIIYYDEYTSLVEYVMSDEADRQLKTVLWSTLKYVDVNTGKKIAHHDKISQYLHAVLYPNVDLGNTDFAQRIKQLAKEYKNRA